MMKKFFFVIVIGLGVLLGTLKIEAATALAASTSTNNPSVGTGQALEIAPPIITTSANPGQVLKLQIELRDISKNNLIVSNQINDFIAAGEDGTPKILLGNNYNDAFSLKNWITPLAQFSMAPQQIEKLTVVINVPANASPGGHYGVIRFTGTPPKLNGTGVSLSASLGALVLLTVNGKINDQLSIAEFSVNDGGKAGSLFESAPLNFVVKLKNTGNIQEEPTGHIMINDMFNKGVATLNVNIPPHNVLPSSTREFVVALNSAEIGNKRLFGHYHATLKLSYGTSSIKNLTANLSFWVIPYRSIAIIIALLIIIFFILRFIIRRYNRSIIKKAQKNQNPTTTTSTKTHQ